MKIKKSSSSTSTQIKRNITLQSGTSESAPFSGEQVQILLDNQNKKHEENRLEWQTAYKELQELFEKTNQERNEKINNQDKKIDDLENRIQNSTSNSFAILSIFATVFIFISLNVNIFQYVKSASEAVFFMFIIACVCCIIISVPLLVLFSLNGHKFQNWKFLLWVYGISIIFLLTVWLITYLGNNFELNTKSNSDKKTEPLGITTTQSSSQSKLSPSN